MPDHQNDAQARFEREIHLLQAEFANAGGHLVNDSAARQAYARQIRLLATDLRAQAVSRRITWSEAAARAHETRNTVMEMMRGRSTPVGRAFAEQLKREGKTLNELVARKTLQLYGPNADFNRLSAAQRDAVYAEIVSSAGRSRPRVTALMRRLGPAGGGLLVISIGISVYNVYSAEDKVAAVGQEVAYMGAGVSGGIAGGAVAGLVCGPGAPVCVTAGAFVGGALAAIGVSLFW